ncbi:MAG: class I SAM-dependent methyltransferase [Candidatus Stahlbacteria bacterium]|nr:class I SAM-dependent methyltransferase [Candidatus Stahlbacteria bacterium]
MSKLIKYNSQLYNDIIEWDIGTWKSALHLWDIILEENLSGGEALELGARNGGVTLYLALKGCNVICSDLMGIGEKAKILHRKYNITHLVGYAEIDATNIPYPDKHFDIVAFKSVLGGIGRENNKKSQQLAMSEIYRILKSGGLLLFAENLTGSKLHMLLRRRLIRWGVSWRYISISEMQEFMTPFRFFKYSTSGFCTAFARTKMFSCALHLLDIIIEPIVGKSNRYVVYGYAKK